MSTPEPTNEQVVEAIYSFSADLMIKGVPAPEIERQLIEKGLDQESAATVVRNLQEARANGIKAAGQKNMMYGALWCIGGIVVTAVTYSAASDGGGKYVVAWGAIVFGAIQFFRGLAQSSGE